MSEKGGDDQSSSRSVSDQPFDDVDSVGGAAVSAWARGSSLAYIRGSNVDRCMTVGVPFLERERNSFTSGLLPGFVARPLPPAVIVESRKHVITLDYIGGWKHTCIYSVHALIVI